MRCRSFRVEENRALEQIAARGRTRVPIFDDKHRTEQEKFLDFGPRWHCLKSLRLGENEALARLELATELQDESVGYRLHPGLLDLTTEAALLINDYGPDSPLYFPMAYKRAIGYRALPSKFFSHIRTRQRQEAEREVATFDITLLDPDGCVTAEIKAIFRCGRCAARGTRSLGPSACVGRLGRARQRRGNRVAWICSRRRSPCLHADSRGRCADGSVVLPDGLCTRTARPKPPREAAPAKPASSMDTVKDVLAKWWQELLGVDQLGVDDDFFELGASP